MGSGASTEQGRAAPAIIDGEAAILERAGGVLLPRDDLYEALKSKLAGADRPVAVVAPSGSGKSTFMANCVTRLREEYDIVRAVFVGSAGGSTDVAADGDAASRTPVGGDAPSAPPPSTSFHAEEFGVVG